MIKSERNERYGTESEQPTERRSIAGWATWLDRVRWRTLRRERTVAPLTMNPDGHLVRQSWLAADDRPDLDCAPCM